MVVTNIKNLEAMKKCDLILEIEALTTLNVNLQMMINELDSKNSKLEARMSHLEKNEEHLNSENDDLKLKVNQLEESLQSTKLDQESTKTILAIITQRLFSFAPIGFRTIIEQLISVKYDEEPLSYSYLKELEHFFSSYVQDKASNVINPKIEEMEDWISATLSNQTSVIKEYKFNNQKKMKFITLRRSALEKIVKLYRNNLLKELKEEIEREEEVEREEESKKEEGEKEERKEK